MKTVTFIQQYNLANWENERIKSKKYEKKYKIQFFKYESPIHNIFWQLPHMDSPSP